jgi:AMP deaminase
MASQQPGPEARTPALEISRPNTPPTPAVHSSPSFDYHEERRLHLQDEIYFSHRLPRLPPPALASPGGNAPERALAPGTSAHPRSYESSADASPSAFHPAAPFTQMRHLTLDEQDGDDGADNLSMDGEHDDGYEGLPGNTRTGLPSRSRQATAPHSPVNSIFPKSDADARTQLLNREEQDAQERLDLEEEKRERLLAEGPAALGAGAQTGGMGASVLEGEYLVLLLSALSSAAGSSFSFFSFHPSHVCSSAALTWNGWRLCRS